MLEHGQERGREVHINQCNLNERIGLACVRLGLRKLSGMRRDAEQGDAPYYSYITKIY
jgi:hypothetical protein